MNCPICESQNTFSSRSIVDVFTKENFQLERCKECDFEYIQNRPGINEISKYYENDLGDIMKTKRDNLSSKMQDIIFSLDLKTLLMNCDQNDLIVDWGAGAGQLTYYLHRENYNVEAIDFNDPEYWIINEVPYTQLNSNDFSSGELDRYLQEKKPKAVILRHTLEHFLRPEKLIETFKKNNVKYILIIVPNNNSLLKKFFGKFWYYWDPPRHLSFFSKKNLDLLHKKNNYRKIAYKTYGIDELYNSFSRWIHLVFGKNSFLSKVFPFNNIISSLVSAASYPFTNTVLWSLYMKEDDE